MRAWPPSLAGFAWSEPALVAGFFVPGIEPIVCIHPIAWLNSPARLAADPVPWSWPIDAWLMPRVSDAARRGPWPAILDPLALVARYLVRA